jgi:hypothetical protein
MTYEVRLDALVAGVGLQNPYSLLGLSFRVLFFFRLFCHVCTVKRR